MKLSVQTRLRAALDRHRIAPHTQREILNDVFSPTSDLTPILKDEVSWDSLIEGAQHSIFVLTSNKSRWPPDMAHLYEEYRSLIHATKTFIERERARYVDDPDNPGAKIPLTLQRAGEIAAAANRKAARENQPRVPACGPHWPSWVKPEAAADMLSRFDVANTARGPSRGKRIVPFATAAVTRDMKRALARHRKFIEDQRAVVSDRPNGMGSTHYRALHLCAMRMAELRLDQYERDVKARVRNPAFSPIPLNWMHLLTKEMRERVRAADEDPASVSPVGLHSFYDDTGDDRCL